MQKCDDGSQRHRANVRIAPCEPGLRAVGVKTLLLSQRFRAVCAVLAALAAHGLAVTVRVRGVFVSNVRNSSENFFRNSFPAWFAALMAAGTAALHSLRADSDTFRAISLLIANIRQAPHRPGYADGSVYLDALSL